MPSYSELPDTIGLLKQLEELNVSNNLLNQVPESVSQLQTLNSLDLRMLALCYIAAFVRQAYIYRDRKQQAG